MTRSEMVDALFERSPLFVSREAFAKSLDGWEIAAVRVDGVVAWITVRRGAEFHFADLGTGKPISRKMIKEFLRPIIAAHGFAMTRTPRDDVRQHRFNYKIGFRPVAEDDFWTTFQIRQLPAERPGDMMSEAKCQS